MNKERSSLKDQMDEQLVKKLQNKKKEWKRQEEEEAERKRQERMEEKKRKEANKSFGELLEESEMDWKKYK